MKRLLLFFSLLFSLSFYGQNDSISDLKTSNISIVSADKMNIVYRGLQNLISIAVPNCKSFSASGNGLYKYAEGKYQLIPYSGLETIVTVNIVLNDGSIKKEEHKFRINNLPSLSGAINGLTCNQSIIYMTKKDLKEATLSIVFPKDFLYELKFNLVSFAVIFESEYINVSVDKFNKQAMDLIEKIPLNSIFEIIDFKSDIKCNNCSSMYISPLKIMIVDENYYHYKKE